MTESKGVRARWGVAALAAPVAAGLFTGATAWAAAHDPTPAAAPATTASQTPTAKQTVDPRVVALQQAVARNVHQVEKLQKTLTALRKKVAAGTPTGSSGGSGGSVTVGAGNGSSSSYSSGSSGSSSARSGSSSGRSSTPAPRPVVAAPAPPATHTSTGASGAKP